MSHRSIYSAAKSGVNVLTANARMDLKAKYAGIHISLVMHGMVETDFYRVANTPQVPRAGSQVGPMIVQSGGSRGTDCRTDRESNGRALHESSVG